MIILDRNLTATELTVPELVYLQMLEEKGNDDYEMPEKLKILFGLDDDTAYRKTEAYLNFRNGEVL